MVILVGEPMASQSIEGMSQTWAAELEGSDVRVNWVDPGDMNCHAPCSGARRDPGGLIQQMSLKFYLLGFRRITGRERAKIPGSVRQLGQEVLPDRGQSFLLTPTPTLTLLLCPVPFPSRSP